MNIEELRNLKNKIEERKRELESRQKRYYEMSLEEFFSSNIFTMDIDKNSITMHKLKSSENTNEVVKKCEKTIKNILLYLSKNDIPYEQIKLIANGKMYCEASFAKKIYECFEVKGRDYQQSKYLDQLLSRVENKNEYKELLKELPNQIHPTYFQVDIEVSCVATLKELPIYSNDRKRVEKFLNNKYIQGVVDINKFVQKMTDLGYIIEFNNKECKSIDDYINEFINTKNGQIYITADFGREKAIQKSKGVKK